MATLLQVDNFRNGIHTKPAEVAEGQGESYARDAVNLFVDGDGFLRTRRGYTAVGPDGDDITGVAASSDSIFVLRSGTLYRRTLTDLEAETEVPGTENLSGRISVVEPAQGYVILTSEGDDQGYWIDLREGETLQAYPLGIDKPQAGHFSITTYPSQGVVNADSDVTLRGPKFFVAYTISYVREFEQQLGLASDELFNGMESAYADPQGFIFERLDINRDLGDARYTDPASVYQQARFDFSPLVNPDNTSNLPDHITGVNIYRSVAIRDDGDAESYAEVTDAFLNHSADLDLSDLVYRKIAFIPRANLHLPFADGIFAVKGENEDQRLNAGDSQDDITGYRAYFHTIPFDINGLGGVLIDVPPEAGIKTDYPWYDDVLMALGLASISVNVSVVSPAEYGGTSESGDRPPVTSPRVQISGEPRVPGIALGSGEIHFYSWDDAGPIESFFDNLRLPSECKQIVLHNDRLFAPAGDRLIYSAFDGTRAAYWQFPPQNVYHRLDAGAVDFCVSFRLDTAGEARGALLFGSRDGIDRLTGDPATLNDEVVSVGNVGPVDAYSLGTLKDSLGFVAEGGLYLTNATQVEAISDVALDRFFEEANTSGAVAFFSDNTILFAVDDQIFLFEDGRWMRWDGLQPTHFAKSGDKIYTARDGELIEIDRAAAVIVDDVDFAWQSNLIHGQSVGMSNDMKRFRELYISAAEGATLTLKTWVDNNTTPVETRFTTRDELGYQHRVPIERMGRRLRFRLEGAGGVEIRGLRIEGDVMPRV